MFTIVIELLIVLDIIVLIIEINLAKFYINLSIFTIAILTINKIIIIL